MDDDPAPEPVVVEHRRELIRMATGILMERYEVPGTTAESALMDWSRVSEIAVHDLARRVIEDVRARAADP